MKNATRTVNGKTVNVNGPYYAFSKPYGTFVTCERDEWYVTRPATAAEKRKSEITKILGTRCLGHIVRFRSNKRRYVISQLHPTQAFSSLDKAIAFLVENDGKLVLCT